MRLLMISGDRSILQGKKGAFWYTLEEFSKHWERIDVICPKTTSDQWSGISGQGSVIRDQVFPNVYFHSSPWGLWAQVWWIHKKGKELVHQYAHNVMTVHEYPPFYNGIGAAWLSHATHVPCVTEVHHIVGYPVPASATERMGLQMSRHYLAGAVRRTAATRVVNAEVKQTLVKWGAPAEKISIVPSFYLDAHTLQPDPSMAKTYDVAFCGRLVANKGLLEFLSAVALLPSTRVLIIGDGPLRSTAEKFGRSQGLQDRIHFAGWLPAQSDVVRALQSAKVFVMNSKSEGGPRIALEAMACGLPVVSTRVGVMPDVIQDRENGLFTTGEPADLAAKMSRLLEDSEYAVRLGQEARKILVRFDRSTLIKAYADFLHAHASNS